MARNKRRKSVLKGLSTLLSRLLCKRSIIVVSDHKTGHLPISISAQLGGLMVVFGCISWVSYSTGSYMAAQSVLAEKDRKIAHSTLENHKIESEFALLKRDLLKILDQKEENLSEYAQFVIEQYQEEDNVAEPIAAEAVATIDHNIVFERIGFLEKQVEIMRRNHAEMVTAIRDTTDGKIKELEKVLAKTGLNQKSLLKEAKKALEKEENPQGGPYDPIYEDNPLIQSERPLFDDLDKMILLYDVLGQLPLDAPMKDYRITSGYGTRIDPFRKRPAHHAGLDFAANEDKHIYAPADGVVTFTGRKGAYGLIIDLDHGLNVSTRYGHLRDIKVREGQQVKKGQVIGVQGNTGRSTGAHLHYEVRYDGKTLNPKNFLKAGHDVQKQQDG